MDRTGGAGSLSDASARITDPQVPEPPRDDEERAIGWLAVPVAILVLELATRWTAVALPRDAIVVVAVALAAAAGGLRVGLAGAAFGWLWSTVRAIVPGQSADGAVSAADALRIGALALAAPALALVVGRLRDRERRLHLSDRDRGLYRGIFEGAPQGMAVLDLQGRYLEQNRAHADIIGYDGSEVLGRTPAQHLGGDAFATIVRDLGEHGRYRGVLTGHTRSGEARTVELSLFAIHDARGALSCYVDVTRDITDQRHGEEQSRRCFEELRELRRLVSLLSQPRGVDEMCGEAVDGIARALAADHCAIVRFQPDGALRVAGARGLSAGFQSSVEGRSSLSDVLRGEDSIDVGDVASDPRLADHRDDLEREGVAALASVPLSINGRQLGTVLIGFDQPHEFDALERGFAEAIADIVTEAIRREEAAGAAIHRERGFRAVADDAAAIIARFDSELRFVYANAAIRSLVGFGPSGVAGRTFRELGMDSAEGDAWDAAIRRAFEANRGVEADLSLGTPDGPRLYRCRLLPETGAGGSADTVLCILEDITGPGRDTELRRMLGKAGSLLVSSLDAQGVLEAVAGLLAQDLGDACAIDLVSPEGVLERAVSAIPDARHATRVDELGPQAASPFDVKAARLTAYRTGTPQLLVDVRGMVVAGEAEDDSDSARVRDLGVRSLLAVPLAARGRAFGVITVLSFEPDRLFTAAELEVAQEIGRRVGLVVDNARLFYASESAYRGKAQLVAIMSHELRTPLNAIIGYTDLLAAGVFGEVPDRQSRHLERIRTSAHHLLAVIEQILALASAPSEPPSQSAPAASDSAPGPV